MLTKKMSPLVVALVATVTASSAWALPAATGSSSAQGHYDYTIGAKSGGGAQKEIDASGALVEVAQSKNGFGFNASAEAIGGSLKAVASTLYNPAPAPAGLANTSSASAFASFTDYVTFSGGTGVSSANFLSSLSGSLAGNKTGYAGFTYEVALVDVADPGWWSTQSLVGYSRAITGNSKVTINDTYETGFDFTFGKTYALVATFRAEASRGGSANFADTATLNFKAGDGVFLTSASGYQYNVPAVPEPQTYAMLLAGLGMVGAMARRRMK